MRTIIVVSYAAGRFGKASDLTRLPSRPARKELVDVLGVDLFRAELIADFLDQNLDHRGGLVLTVIVAQEIHNLPVMLGHLDPLDRRNVVGNIANGLDLGLDFEYWTGSNPSITKVSPRLDYVFNTGGALRPYGGVFYRRTMIEGLEDLDSIGGRAGLYFMSGKGVYVGAGLVYESYLSCNTATYSSCADTYPELVVAFSF